MPTNLIRIISISRVHGGLLTDVLHRRYMLSPVRYGHARTNPFGRQWHGEQYVPPLVAREDCASAGERYAEAMPTDPRTPTERINSVT